MQDSLEFTKAHGIRFKPPKSKAGRREITLPDILINVLRDYRKAQLELRLKLGAGKLQDDDLLFTAIDGAPLSLNAVSAFLVWVSDIRLTPEMFFISGLR